MQYKKNQKIIIDSRKLEVLIRLGCPDEIILQKIKTGKSQKTGDKLIDETLECLVDFKEFENWGGKRDGSGRPRKISIKNQDKNQDDFQDDFQDENQDGNQDGNQVVNQDVNQVVDIDKDIDIDKNNKINYNKNNITCPTTLPSGWKNIEMPKDEIIIPLELREAMDLWLKYRKEIKKPYKPMGLRECVKKLEKLSGNDRAVAVAIVRESISNGWTGLFPLKKKLDINGKDEYKNIVDMMEKFIEGEEGC